MDKDLRGELTCPVCMELFSRPLRLGCGHSYCRRCLMSIERRSFPVLWDLTGNASAISCPECRHLFDLPASGIDSLPMDFKLAKLVEVYKKMDGIEDTDAEQTGSEVEQTGSEVEQTTQEVVNLGLSNQNPVQGEDSEAWTSGTESLEGWHDSTSRDSVTAASMSLLRMSASIPYATAWISDLLPPEETMQAWRAPLPVAEAVFITDSTTNQNEVPWSTYSTTTNPHREAWATIPSIANDHQPTWAAVSTTANQHVTAWTTDSTTANQCGAPWTAVSSITNQRGPTWTTISPMASATSVLLTGTSASPGERTESSTSDSSATNVTMPLSPAVHTLPDEPSETNITTEIPISESQEPTHKGPKSSYKAPESFHKGPESSHKGPKYSYKGPESSYKRAGLSYEGRESSEGGSVPTMNKPERIRRRAREMFVSSLPPPVNSDKSRWTNAPEFNIYRLIERRQDHSDVCPPDHTVPGRERASEIRMTLNVNISTGKVGGSRRAPGGGRRISIVGRRSSACTRRTLAGARVAGASVRNAAARRLADERADLETVGGETDVLGADAVRAVQSGEIVDGENECSVLDGRAEHGGVTERPVHGGERVHMHGEEAEHIRFCGEKINNVHARDKERSVHGERFHMHGEEAECVKSGGEKESIVNRGRLYSGETERMRGATNASPNRSPIRGDRRVSDRKNKSAGPASGDVPLCCVSELLTSRPPTADTVTSWNDKTTPAADGGMSLDELELRYAEMNISLTLPRPRPRPPTEAASSTDLTKDIRQN